MHKSDLRRQLLANRRPCPEKDARILDYLLSLNEFGEAELILSYISTVHEIDTRKFISRCFAAGKRVAVPKTEVHGIEFYEIFGFGDVAEGKFGILEPVNSCVPVQINKDTLCVVPALACNEHGERIGYGKGYYDRYLNSASVRSAALCYAENVISFAAEPHDEAVDLIITEGGVLFGRQNRDVL
jgi:5-formyltetrahydrofolate cyclo-ligase